MNSYEKPDIFLIRCVHKSACMRGSVLGTAKLIGLKKEKGRRKRERIIKSNKNKTKNKIK